MQVESQLGELYLYLYLYFCIYIVLLFLLFRFPPYCCVVPACGKMVSVIPLGETDPETQEIRTFLFFIFLFPLPLSVFQIEIEAFSVDFLTSSFYHFTADWRLWNLSN